MEEETINLMRLVSRQPISKVVYEQKTPHFITIENRRKRKDKSIGILWELKECEIDVVYS
jgi:hypothetical protein